MRHSVSHLVRMREVMLKTLHVAGDNDWGRGKYAHHSMDYMYVFGK